MFLVSLTTARSNDREEVGILHLLNTDYIKTETYWPGPSIMDFFLKGKYL